MKREQQFKFQRVVHAFDQAKAKYRTDEEALERAIETWEAGRERSNDDIARDAHIVANGRWIVVLLALCWLSVAYITRDMNAVSVAAATTMSIGAAWVADQTRGAMRILFAVLCVLIPVNSFLLLLWVTS